jgi:MmyB-like transcription regulator ligand binding domain
VTSTRRPARTFTSGLRAAYSRHGASSRAGAIVTGLPDRSPEFAGRWAASHGRLQLRSAAGDRPAYA